MVLPVALTPKMIAEMALEEWVPGAQMVIDLDASLFWESHRSQSLERDLNLPIV